MLGPLQTDAKLKRGHFGIGGNSKSLSAFLTLSRAVIVRLKLSR
jgi:hypothetical protein